MPEQSQTQHIQGIDNIMLTIAGIFHVPFDHYIARV